MISNGIHGLLRQVYARLSEDTIYRI